MLRYNKAVENIQFRFADAMRSMDPRFDLESIEAVMTRDQYMPHVDKFLLGSPKVPALFLLVSDLLWSTTEQDVDDGEAVHLDKIMFTSKITNATGVAAIVYAVRVPNPHNPSDATQSGRDGALVDVGTEVLFGVLQNNPVEEFVALARDILIPIGVQCHQLTVQDFAKRSAVDDMVSNSRKSGGGEGSIGNVNRSLRTLMGYSSERSREKTTTAVESFYSSARASVDNIDRLDRDKEQLVGFVLEDPQGILRRVQPTSTGIERAAKDPIVAEYTTQLFATWINYARQHGDRDSISGFYPIVTEDRVQQPHMREGASGLPTPAQHALTIPKMADSVRLSAVSAADPTIDPSEATYQLVALDPPRQYDFQRLPESYGPLTELSHWKSFELHVQHLYDSRSSRDVATLEAILERCNPTLHSVWVATVKRLQTSYRNAKEVVMYFSSLSRCFEPLYSLEPAQCVHHMRDVVKALTNIRDVIPHYRRTDHMQQLVQSVSHQLVSACKQSIRSLGRVWEQSENTVQLQRLLRKFTEAMSLCRMFQDILSDTAMYSELDELCIFGKLELFCSRLNKLSNLFSIVRVFRTLEEYHLGDGIAPILSTFFGIFEDLRRKSGDSLDYTKPSFDKDYLDFVNKVADVDCSLQVYVNSCFEDVPNTTSALELLKKFSLLVTRPTLRADLQAKYLLLFQRFGTELEAVQRIYEQSKSQPLVMRNAPPVAGRMLWVRQLHQRIEVPMKIFQESQSMVSHQRDTAKIIRLYNRVALALTEYEQYWLQTWQRAVEMTTDGLKATVLVAEGDGKYSYVVNLDRSVAVMAREARWIVSLGLQIPSVAADLLRCRAAAHAVAIGQCVRWYDESIAAIQRTHVVVLQERVAIVQHLFHAACSTITWNSPLLSTFIQDLANAIEELAALIKRLNSTEEHLIDKPVRDVAETCIVPRFEVVVDESVNAFGGSTAIPSGPPVVTLEVMVERIAEAATRTRNDFSTNNKVVRDAVIDLCSLIDPSWHPSTHHDDHPTVPLSQMYIAYNRKLFRAVLQATLNSFRDLRTLIAGRSAQGTPRIVLESVLAPPNLFVSPSMEEIQASMHLSMRLMLESTQSTGNWPNVRGAYSTGDSAAFYEEIHRNKEVVKQILLTSGDILNARRQMDDFLKSFDMFRNVWTQNPADVVKIFADHPNRTLEDYLEELQCCTRLMHQVELIPNTVEIQCFTVDNTQLKQALVRILERWCDRYGAALHTMLERQLGALLDRSEAISKRVSHEAVITLENIDGELQGLDDASSTLGEVEVAVRTILRGSDILTRFGVGQPTEIVDLATDITFKWKRIQAVSSDKRHNIGDIQLSLRHELNEALKKFHVEMLCFRNNFEENGPLVEGIEPNDAIEKLRRFQRALDDKLRTWGTHFKAEQRFGVPEPKTYPELALTVKEMHVADLLYTLYLHVNQRLETIGRTLWRLVKYDDVVHELMELQYRIKRLPSTIKTFKAFHSMRDNVERLLDMQQIVEQLGHRSVRERHWQQVMRICGSTWNIDKDVFTLDMLWNANLVPFKDDIIELAMASEKEGEVELKLQQVIREWKDKELRFAEYKHRGLILLKGDDTTNLKESLEEALVLLGSLLASKYIAPFRHEASSWSSRLMTVGETITLWLEVQSAWMYLEAVFSSGDIVKQLPQDAKRFSMIDRQWVKLFFRAVESPNLLEFSVSNEIKNLPYFKDQLELCQRALAQYLESKRSAFARFYFVSDAVLLEVLAQGSDPTAMQPHFSAIYDGIHSVQLEPTADKKLWKVKALVSAEDEVVHLSEMVSCEGSIEEWLARLTSEMQHSIRVVLREAVGDALSIRTDVQLLKRYYMAHFSQAVLTALQVLYTTSVTEALSGPPSARRDMTKRLTECKDVLAEQARGSLSSAARTHIQTLTTMAVHNLEVWEDYGKKAKDVMSFEWQRQLRFYWTDRNECVLRIADADVTYCNEYLGVKERLVITPLTDRCYITLSQALAMYMGGAPAGPAGTGKTETVKDLGRAAGIYVVVFNCSDQFDARATAKIFRGLAQSGCWGCLDEFNRITLPVLSVVSQQVRLTFAALKQHSREFLFADGLPCKLVSSMGVFVTMNPGYAGRQELPENLKAHFRSVSMMVPDRLCIMKTKLAAAGYKMDKPLSQKFHLLYALCEQQLSKQRHYDFGLRNILSVLRTAGDVLRQSQSNDEEAVFMRCVRDMNVAKFVHDDVPVFLSLLQDIFVGKVPERLVFRQLEQALRDAAVEQRLTVSDTWMKKCIELYETKRVRHGVMLVGPAGGGKTSCMRALLRALHAIESRHKEVRLHPKAVTVEQLFGTVNSNGDWRDGIFSYLWRRWNRERGTSVWLVCDGPVDTLWIESLNTVLDDNRVLTLANGDRVLMNPSLRMCFEVENLHNASPATVSRAGIIYVSREDVSWRSILQSSVEEQIAAKVWPVSIKDTMLILLQGQLGSVHKHVVKTYRRFPGLSLSHLCGTVLSLIRSLIAAIIETHGTPDTRQHAAWTGIRMAICYGVFWGIGGSLDVTDRTDLAYRMTVGKIPSSTYEVPPNIPLPIPATDDTPEVVHYIDAYFVDVEHMAWSPWADHVPEWHVHWDIKLPSVNATGVFVPHLASTILHNVMHVHFEDHQPVLLIGTSGASKTALMEEFLNAVRTDDMAWTKKNISRATTPLQLQRVIEGLCEKRMGSMFGPLRNRRLNLFIDDIGMAERNEWGDQPTGEILRQLMECGGFYSVDRIGDFHRFIDIKFFAALTSESGRGGSDTSQKSASQYIPSRLMRHFAVYNCPMPSETSLKAIFGAILLARFANTHLVNVCGPLVSTTVELFKRCQLRLLPSPSRAHYNYSLRDLTRTFQGMLMCPIQHLDSGAGLVALWHHEVSRIFADKLCFEEDAAWFKQELQICARDSLGSFHLEPPATTGPRVVFANFLGEKIRDNTSGEFLEPPKEYRPCPAHSVQAKAYHRMQEFNETRNVRTSPIDIVLFDAALDHVCRLCRIISIARGSALCIGYGGSGKQTTARLAAYLQQQPIFQPAVNTEYSILNWLEDLRGQYFAAAAHGHCVMLITDNDIKSEEFLEYINTSLSSGDVPGLFTTDEREAARNTVRPIAKKLNRREFEDSEEWLWQYFIQRVQDHLHFVICMSPQGERFQQRVRRFPAMIASCTIDYYFPWSREAMLKVTEVELEKTDFLTRATASPHAAAKLPHALVDVESCVRTVSQDYFIAQRLTIGITPAGFLSFLKTFVKVYRRKENSLRFEAKNLRIGLQKLNQAGRDVVAMRKELNLKEIALAASAAELEKLLDIMSVKVESATSKKMRVQEATDKIAEEAAQVAAGRQEAENDLVAAQPALESAKAALEQITPTDIITLRAMRRPPEMIRRIFDGVCVLLHQPLEEVRVALSNGGRARIEDSWSLSGRQVCSRPNLLDTLLAFNVDGKDRLNDETCELLLPYLWQEDFTYDRAKVASGNIAGLCTWVRAMETYRRVAKFVAPKIDALRTAEAMLRIADAKLQTQRAELEVAEKEMNECIAEVEVVQREKDILEADTNRTKRRLAYASMLIDALADEKRRWEEQESAFNVTMERLLGDSVSAAAMVAFAGPFQAELRAKLLRLVSEALSLHRIPYSSKSFDFTRFMVKEETIAQWAEEGLPMDTQSIENAVITEHTQLVPCFVDPQTQARSWLQEHLADHNAVFTTMASPHFMRTLERQMERGDALVIEDAVFGSDPLLQAILAMRPTKPLSNNLYGSPMAASSRRTDLFSSLTLSGGDAPNSPELVCYILGTSYPCSSTFKLYLIPSKTRVDFTPEVFSKVCIMDNSVTEVGLEQQLLARVISIEKGELEEQRIQVLNEIRRNEETLRQLEEELLSKLSNSSGSLVDDETLILTLQNSKSSAEHVKEQLTIASATKKEIQSAREAYRPVSIRGALLYFVIAELAKLEPSYQMSLDRMLAVFVRGVETSLAATTPAQRIQNIAQTVTQLFFALVGRGLFERHKTLFSLSIAIHVEIQSGAVSVEHFRLFLAGGSSMEAEAQQARAKSSFAWLSPNAWRHIVALLEKSPTLGTILEAISKAEQPFRQWYESETPETEVVPYYSKLTPFDRLLLIRCLREDRTMNAAAIYVRDVLGPNLVEVPSFSLEQIAKAEANIPRTPVLFLLTPGSDPTPHIEQLSKRLKAHMQQLSIGQGQEEVAIHTLHTCALSGEWVVFQNCHLGPSFLAYLERWVQALHKARDVPLDTPPDPSLPPPSKASRAMREQTGYARTTTSLGPLVAAKKADAIDRMTIPDHPDFRVFLTMEPTVDLPEKLLLRSLPLTNEPPTGTRATIKKILNWVQQDTWDLFPQPQWRACVQALCFYHCVLLERRKHGIYGWSKPYQFTEGDFVASLFFLQNLFGSMSDEESMKPNSLSWEAVRFMIGDIHYGGRVTIRNDRATLQAVTESIFSPQLNMTSSKGTYLQPSTKRFPILADINDVGAWHRAVLDQYQVHEAPSFAGLGANAEVAHRTKQAQSTLQALLSVQPRKVDATDAATSPTGSAPSPTTASARRSQQEASSPMRSSSPRKGGRQQRSSAAEYIPHAKSTGGTQEESAQQIVAQCLKHLPTPWTDVELLDLVEQRDRLKPMTIFFHLEAQHLREVIYRAREVFVHVVHAVSGAAALTAELSETISCLVLGLVPEGLKAGTWPASSFGSWFAMLLRRHRQIMEYLQKGECLVYDVACFFNPQGFLNSIRQQVCRARGPSSGWVLGRVETKLTVTKFSVGDVERPAEEGAFLTGFYLDGAGWDVGKGRLRAPQPKELYRELPIVMASAQLAVSAPVAPKAADGGERRGTSPKRRDDAAEKELAAFGAITQAAFRAHRTQREADSVIRKARIPCFTSATRTDESLLCYVDLAHEDPDPYAWTLRGVAVLTSIE